VPLTNNRRLWQHCARVLAIIAGIACTFAASAASAKEEVSCRQKDATSTHA